MTKFQQRHYEAIAKVLHDSKLAALDTDIQAVQMVQARLETMFQLDNPKFRADLFQKAAA